jgi:hypothetical protein
MIDLLATAIGGFMLGWLAMRDVYRRRRARILALPPARIVRGDVVANEQRGAAIVMDCECGLGGGVHVHVHSWRDESRPRAKSPTWSRPVPMPDPPGRRLD